MEKRSKMKNTANNDILKGFWMPEIQSIENTAKTSVLDRL